MSNIKWVQIVTALTLMTLQITACFAADVSGTGLVNNIRTHDATVYPDWAPPRFWFTLKGVTSAGTCPLYGNLVLFIANDTQKYAMVMTAQATGKAIIAYADDSVRINGFCSAKIVDLEY